MFMQQSDIPSPHSSSQLNWPNRITLIRIFLVPILLVFLISPHGWYPMIAATIFVIAAFTDWLDGHLARSTNQITRLGQLLDPIADKLLVTSALVSLVGRQVIPAWVVAIILCRELAITGLRALAADSHIIIAAEVYGKYKMVFLIIACPAPHAQSADVISPRHGCSLHRDDSQCHLWRRVHAEISREAPLKALAHAH